MASQSVPIPLAKTKEHIQSRVIARVPSMRTVAIVFATLLILLFWLHFILAMDIISTNRQIRIMSQEIEQEKRKHAAFQSKIGTIGSQRNMQERAEDSEYEYREPLYLVVPETHAQPNSAMNDGQAPDSTTITSGELPPIQASLGVIVIGDSGLWSESEKQP
jgi:hypothetical protein